MSTPTVFVDRDGTLIEEPPDNQVDDLRKVRFLPGVFAALAELTRRGFRLVMVTNQDGLGTERFPRVAFEACHEFVLEAFRSQGVVFDAIFICPHLESEGCTCRKPRIGLLEDDLRRYPIDPVRSAVIGDRGSDLPWPPTSGSAALRSAVTAHPIRRGRACCKPSRHVTPG